MRPRKIISVLNKLIDNAKKLISIAWTTDKKLTLFYYTTAALGATAPIFASVAMKYLIDFLQSAQANSLQNIPMLLIFVLASYYFVSIVEDVVYYGLNYSYLDFLFRYKLQNEISYRFYQKVSNLDIAHFENPNTQDLITKTRDTMLWRIPDFLRHFRDLFANIVTYTSAFVVLLPFGMWIPILITIITLPRIYLRAKHGSLQWSIYGSGAPQAKKLWYMGWLLQTPKTIKEMRIFQSTSSILSRYRKIQEYLYNLNKKPLDKYVKVRNFPTIIEISLIFSIAYIFIPQTISGVLTIGSFTLLLNMMARLNANAASAAQRMGELYENNLYVNHFFDTVTLPKLVKQLKGAVSFKKIAPPEIQFKNVDFNYPGGPRVLHNISLTISQGESVAFVGENGAGKSTLIKLLCRFYDVSKGSILINSINIKKLKLSNWYKFLGTLFQEFTQFQFTVRDNITLGDPGKNNEKAVVEASKKAGAYEFIQKLPKKFNTILGRQFEEGEELSVGQWQKLAIARAFYEEPPVLILDEPTSAIDAEAEYEIFNNLQKQYNKKTLILVSHRFSTVRNANKIFVIDEGKIIEQGTHKELMLKRGKYHKMFTIQAEGYK